MCWYRGSKKHNYNEHHELKFDKSWCLLFKCLRMLSKSFSRHRKVTLSCTSYNWLTTLYIVWNNWSNNCYGPDPLKMAWAICPFMNMIYSPSGKNKRHISNIWDKRHISKIAWVCLDCKVFEIFLLSLQQKWLFLTCL